MSNRFGKGQNTTVFIIQARYDGKWEYVSEYGLDHEAEAREDFRRYLSEEPQYPHRLIKRRVPNKNYQGGDDE